MKLPTFSLPAQDEKTYTDQDFQKGIFVLYVYPKDDTPGCTLEAKDFQTLKPEFEKLGVKVFGLSADSLKSHEKFCNKYGLAFILLSDEEKDLLQKLGVWKEKSMYGKTYMGAERTTFVIKDGEIIKEWKKVSVPEHAKEVLEFVKGL